MFTFHCLFFTFLSYVILHTFLNLLCYFFTPVLIWPHLSFKFSKLLFSLFLSPLFLLIYFAHCHLSCFVYSCEEVTLNCNNYTRGLRTAPLAGGHVPINYSWRRPGLVPYFVIRSLRSEA